jgi:hypothetical protein
MLKGIVTKAATDSKGLIISIIVRTPAMDITDVTSCDKLC